MRGKKHASQFLWCLALLFNIDGLQSIKISVNVAISVFGFYGYIINIRKIFVDIFMKYQ